jgi:hypothetical protein
MTNKRKVALAGRYVDRSTVMRDLGWIARHWRGIRGRKKHAVAVGINCSDF